jgi:dephospho-CoA kinase
MKIVGITGGTGAGKSLLSAELKKRGATIVDSDLISRQIMKKGEKAFQEVVKAFGSEVLDKDGNINRKKLGKIVFNDSLKLELLDKITHKYIFERMEKEISSSKSEIVVLDVPLLFQCDFPIKYDMSIAVIADQETRINRIVNRDNISKDEALLRIKNQLSNDKYIKLADLCFENNGDCKAISDFADSLYLMLKK